MLPAVTLLNICHLAIKPSGDDRAIAATAMVLRLWASANRWEADSWCKEKAQFWDQAVAGSAALQCALSRCLKDEVTDFLGGG